MQTNITHNFTDSTNGGSPSFEVFLDGHRALRVTADAATANGEKAGHSAVRFYNKAGEEVITIDENNTGEGLDGKIDAHFENEFGEGASAVMRELSARAAAKLRTVYEISTATGMPRELVGRLLDGALEKEGEQPA